MKHMSVAALSALTASNSPAHGGGSVSALAGAYGAALICMVARLTLGKHGYEDVYNEMEAVIEKAEATRKWLLDSIHKDSEAFSAVMNAISMPKSCEEENTVRVVEMQKAFRDAAAVPYAVAEKAYEIMELAEPVIRHGNKAAVTDGLVAAILCRAAVRGAILNVRINLDAIRDEEYAIRMRADCTALEQKAAERETAVFALVPEPA